jgi:hypothetical protein
MLGVAPDRVYVDHGLTGTNRERPGLRQALAACRAGDTLACRAEPVTRRCRKGLETNSAQRRVSKRGSSS